MHISKTIRLLIAIATPLLAIALITIAYQLLARSVHFPVCIFHRLTGGWCPACGNTRCVIRLMHFEPIQAMRSNITIPFLTVLLICLYIENLLAIFGKNIYILSRRGTVWYVVIGIFILYYILRNFIPILAPV